MKNLFSYALFGLLALILFACSKELFNNDSLAKSQLSARDNNDKEQGLFQIMSDPSCGHTEYSYVTTEKLSIIENTRRTQVILYMTDFDDQGGLCSMTSQTIMDETNPIWDTTRVFGYMGLPVEGPPAKLPHDEPLPPYVSVPYGCLVYGDKKFDFQSLVYYNYPYFNQSFQNAQQAIVVEDLINKITDFMNYIDFGQVDPYDTYGMDKVRYGLFAYALSQNLGPSFARLFVENAFPGTPPYNSCGQQEIKYAYLHLVDAYEDNTPITLNPWDVSWKSVAQYIIYEIQAHRL